VQESCRSAAGLDAGRVAVPVVEDQVT
jgi:hypothetical protein